MARSYYHNRYLKSMALSEQNRRSLQCWPKSVIFPAFKNPRELVGYRGLVPSESSTGDKVKRGRITKAGNKAGNLVISNAALGDRVAPAQACGVLARPGHRQRKLRL
jgi:transposase